MHYGDLTDANSLNYIVSKVKPDEVYNLAAQSHVGVSFENPEYTAQVTGLGTLRLLESVRILSLKKVKFYQASTSELFGEKFNYGSFNERSVMSPKSPYGAAKLYSHNITQMYRDSYNLFACSGILFNHESPRRGETFVTRKITMFLAKWMKSKKKRNFIFRKYLCKKRLGSC